jgi:hypothetical protein
MSDFTEKLVPEIIDNKIKKLFDIFEEVYYNKVNPAMSTVKKIYDSTYELPEEILELMFQLYNLTASDLTYFSDIQRKSIKNKFINNVFTFYRTKLKDSVFYQMLYIYGLKGVVYPLDTLNFSEYYRSTNILNLIELLTDVGLETDVGYETDNVYRTPFIEVEIELNKYYSNVINELWFSDLDINFKRDIDNIRHVLSKIYYTLKLPVSGKVSDTVTNSDNLLSCVTGSISALGNLYNYRVIYSDDSYDTFIISDKSEDASNYYINTENIFVVDKYIKSIVITDILNTTTYSTITFPQITLKEADKLLAEIIITK